MKNLQGTKESRITLAREFYKAFNFDLSMEIGAPLSRDNFDLWIIDHKLATDPETEDPKTLAFKGFLTERTQARKAINNGAKLLPPGENYAISIDPQDAETYRVKSWDRDSLDYAKGIGKRIEKFSNNKAGRVVTLRAMASSSRNKGPALNDFLKMLTIAEDFAINLDHTIEQGTIKYNSAMEMLERAAKNLELGQDDAG
jgi:hypothetical protein